MDKQRDDTTAGLMKRLVESTAAKVDWSVAREILDVSSREEVVELLAQALVKARDELTTAQASMALLVQTQSEHAILTTDVNGNVVSVTSEGARLLGWPLEKIIGQPIDLILADRFNAVAESSPQMDQAEDLGTGGSSEQAHVREDGTRFSADHAVFVLMGEGGHLTGFVNRIEDVTAREAHEVHIEELNATIALLIG
jgi:PAS domain S-box-containing protein